MKRLFYLFVAGALALASCGGDDDDPVTTDNNGGSNSGSSDNNGSSATKSTDWTMPLYTVSQDGDTTSFRTYDENNLLTSVRYSDGTSETYEYDSNGHLISYTNSDGKQYSYTINGLTRTSTTKNSSELLCFCVYDGNGENGSYVEYSKSVETFTDDTFKKYASVVAYDEDGNVNVTIDYTYNDNGLITKKVFNYKGEPYAVWEYKYGDKEMTETVTCYYTTYTISSHYMWEGYKAGDKDFAKSYYYTYKDDKYEYPTSYGSINEDGTSVGSEKFEYDDQNRVVKEYYGGDLNHCAYTYEYFDDYAVRTRYEYDWDNYQYTDEVASVITIYYLVH